MHNGMLSSWRRSRARCLTLPIFLVFALIVLPIGVGSTPGAAAQGAAGGTLRLFYWQAPTILNPHLSSGTKDLSASRITYEPLASYDKDGNMVPFLAAEIPSLENGGVASDGRSITWKLKPGITWSDGEPFTADDVLFTYEYVTNPDVESTSAASYAGIERVEAVDDLTVRVVFKEATPAWSLPFVGSLGMIIPRHVFQDFNGPTAQEAPGNLAPVGTGPYRVVEFSTEDVLVIGEDAVETIKIVYEVNPFFRGPNKPSFGRVELQGGGGDAAFATQAVQDGLADYAWNAQLDDATLEQLEADGQHKAIIAFGAFVERIMINFTDPNAETAEGERSSTEFPHPFLTDKKVRQAIAHAIDREAIAALYGPTGRATTNLLVSPPSLNSPNTEALYPFDIERAAALLDESGWIDSDGDGVREKDGQPLKLVFLTSISPVRQETQEIVKAALESIGFSVESKSVDSSIFLGPPEESTNTRRHFYADVEEFAFSNKSPDPTAYMKGWTCGEIAQMTNNWSLSNWARYCNPAYDALYEQVAKEIDPEKQRQLFIQMNDFLIEDVALIPLVHFADVSVINSSLTGLDVTPWDVEVWNIMDWRMT
jgi:peptide/nickel transport system substrate-binding protein